MFIAKLLVVLYYCTTVSTDQYYVVAENTTDCQPADGECHPLSFYVAHSSSYFTNNTVFYFKNGIHILMGNGILLTGVQNVSLIGANQHVIINPLVIHSCANISIINITVLCVMCDAHFEIYINYSSNIDIFNVNSSDVGVYNSFGVAVYNTYIYDFNVTFESAVHCYDTLRMYDFKAINSTFASIRLTIQQGASYVLNVTLDSVILLGGIGDIYIFLNPSSLYSIDINNVSCYEYTRVLFINLIGSNYIPSCQNPNINLPINSIVITNSYFYDELSIEFLVHSNSQNISISSNHSVFKGLDINTGNINKQIHQSLTVHLMNTQLVNDQNSISNLDNVIFSNVSISKCVGTGLSLINTKLTINGSFTVSNNIGVNGGGMALYGSSRLEIHPNSNLTFIANHASNKGGGIYRTTFLSSYLTDCDIIYVPDASNVSFYFINNVAAVGDDIDGIVLTDPSCPMNMSVFKTDVKSVTAPFYICFCANSSYYTCTYTVPKLYVFPGEKIYYKMALWDVNHQITSGTVVRYLNDTYIDIIHIGSNCTEISFTAIMNSSAVDFVLKLPSTDLGTLTVPISILPCPIGFTYTHGICTCSSSITAENLTCDIDTLQISRKGQLWIGPYNTSITINASQPNDHNVCFINEQCLLCNPSNVSFMLNDTDPQCQQHKSGTLCGSCTTGYSLVLGSNECMECTTNYSMALIILFAFMGIGLVILLFVLNLTISVGTINGLLLAANVIKLYQPVFLGNQIPVPFLSLIISWINLDFGIKICFYNGMDRYVKEWLQFAFPFYVWAIIIVIILICRVSPKVSKLVGSNTVPVLSTLLLLSYTKAMPIKFIVSHYPPAYTRS